MQERLQVEILILDGAQGTMIQPHISAGSCYDMANLENPGVVSAMYAAYAKSGADIISTNTFGASRIKLQEFGLGERASEINRAGADLAKKAVGDRAWIAGCIGPTGKLISPIGALDFDETYDVFRQQVLALAEGGVDLFLLETFSDLKEVKIAVMAVRENTDLPVMASMTFEESFTTFTGTDPVTAANVLVSLGIDVLGVNCSTGPEPMLEVLGRYAMTTDCPLYVEPNAGLPRLDRNNEAVYLVSPEEMAVYGERFVEIGACVVGSCCGSTPEFTKALKDRLGAKKPVSRHVEPFLRLSSRVHTVQLGRDLPFCVIGERINPTNRENLTQELREGKMGHVQREAQSQAEQGAHVLDLNVGVPGIDEAAVMARCVEAVENVVNLPLCIDSVNPSAVEMALRESAGKLLINSVNGEEKRLDEVIPLAKRYGAGLICLAVGDGGIPKTAEERLAIIKKIILRAEEAGIHRNDLICDCLTLTVSAQQKRAEETLKAIRMIKEETGLPTVLGVSNISYGLPERSLINATFLSMAMASGLDAAIMNPGDVRMMETVLAGSVLTVRDRDSRAYVRRHMKKKKKKSGASEQLYFEEDWSIPQAVAAGNREEIGSLVEKALADGRSAHEINTQFLIPAIQEVGRKYDRKEIYLPQMILAAETMKAAFNVLEPHFDASDRSSKGTVLLCTVKGDVHDIGKNIVGLFLRNHGFDVVDMGKDVASETIVKKAGEVSADVVGLSALMTTTMVEMPGIIASLKTACPSVKIIIGGAVVTQRYADQIGAHGYAKDAVEAVAVVNTLLGSNGNGA